MRRTPGPVRTLEGKFTKPDDEIANGRPMNGYFSAEETLQILFPSKASRISLKWFMRLRYKNLVPYRKFGSRLFFNPAEVQRALDKVFKIEAVE